MLARQGLGEGQAEKELPSAPFPEVGTEDVKLYYETRGWLLS